MPGDDGTPPGTTSSRERPQGAPFRGKPVRDWTAAERAGAIVLIALASLTGVLLLLLAAQEVVLLLQQTTETSAAR